MEGTLDPDLLSLALGDHAALPSPERLASLIADAELRLLIRKPGIPEELSSLAWYLHAVASSKHATRSFGIVRQRAAFNLSSHIFDLMLLSTQFSSHERLKITFAAQISALRGDSNPNSIATYIREVRPYLHPLDLVTDAYDISLTLAVALLGMDVQYVYDTTDAIRSQAASLAKEWGVDSIVSTPFAAPSIVSLCARDLMSFLAYGSATALARAQDQLRALATDTAFDHDRTSQWVAAHLLNLSSDLESSSIWTLIPPSIPPTVPRSFAMGHPRVVSLWPPQIDFIKPESASSPSPFSPDVRRLFLSTPTSSGKTLIAQLLIAAHVATQPSAVCYVAPTRSLCREIAAAIDERLRYLGATSVHSLPEGDLLDEFFPQSPAVEVVTPERLSFMLRSDPTGVLNRFGLFVFDEVHTVGEKGRGWTLEQEITYLHSFTLHTAHRIVILSAAIGNKAHFIEWLTPEGSPVFHRHSTWRGTRRLSAIWSTWADWQASVTSPTRSTTYPWRIICPLYGRLDARLGATGKTHSLRTTDPIGQLALRVSQSRAKSRDTNLTTPFYRMLAPLVSHLAEAGPVLVIESTRRMTVALAVHLASTLDPPDPFPTALSSLSDLVRSRLGEEHPLSALIAKRVAYHHGGLSPDVRAAIEDAVTQGHINILVATTTMTEGVNLPVRSVVVASQGSFGATGYSEYITGPRLINAIGRAGRATKETEGIVVLARNNSPSHEDFDRLNPSDADALVQSTIATQEALDALAEFEEYQRVTEDAVLSFVGPPVSDFIAYIWFIASALEISASAPDENAVSQAVRATLGWKQLPDPDRDRWLAVALSTLDTYRRTNHSSRLRWPTAGTTIGSARLLEDLAKEAATSLAAFSPFTSPTDFILSVFNDARLAAVLSLPEAPSINLYNRRASPREPISIRLPSLLGDWLAGQELADMATTHFSEVDAAEFRYEQLSDCTNQLFEVFLPWILGALTSWINGFLEEAGSLVRLPRALPAYLRWGVENQAALQLMVSGLYSRTLATRASSAWIQSGAPGDIIEWLRSMDLREWRESLSASVSDLRQLLELVRSRPEGLAYILIANGTASISVRSNLSECPPTPVYLQQEDPRELSTIRIAHGDDVLGEIRSRDHSDLQSVLSSGLPISATFSASSDGAFLRLQLRDID